MTYDDVMRLFSFLFGLCLGSFLNVCIYRIPLNRSVISPPSSCPSCGEKIRFYDNIPVISFILLAGRCRHCKTALTWRYPLVEVLTGFLSLYLFIRFGLHSQYFLWFLFSISLLTLSFIDLEHKILPDVLTLPGIVVGFAVSFLPWGLDWMDSLIGLLAGGGSLYLVAWGYERITGREGMGGGDIKLLAMIGAWLGWQSLPLVVLMSSLCGAIIGGFVIIVGRKGARAQIPFGPFLSMGALAYLFFGPAITHWYFSLFVWHQ
jgi:leader peptidase (prepilin peptidase)/N-methyltransferase